VISAQSTLMNAIELITVGDCRTYSMPPACTVCS
jgi:hypothetical protein